MRDDKNDRRLLEELDQRPARSREALPPEPDNWNQPDRLRGLLQASGQIAQKTSSPLIFFASVLVPTVCLTSIAFHPRLPVGQIIYVAALIVALFALVAAMVALLTFYRAHALSPEMAQVLHKRVEELEATLESTGFTEAIEEIVDFRLQKATRVGEGTTGEKH